MDFDIGFDHTLVYNMYDEYFWRREEAPFGGGEWEDDPCELPYLNAGPFDQDTVLANTINSSQEYRTTFNITGDIPAFLPSSDNLSAFKEKMIAKFPKIYRQWNNTTTTLSVPGSASSSVEQDICQHAKVGEKEKAKEVRSYTSEDWTDLHDTWEVYLSGLVGKKERVWY